jgi:aspartate aminotransferase
MHMGYQLSERVCKVKASPTLQITARAAALRAEGRNIISLGSGEPDFDTPLHIREAAKRAIDEGKTRYTPVDGIPELKQAVVDKYQRDNGLGYTLNEVIVGTGGKQLIYNLFQAILNAGDEVLIPSPYWVSYPDMALLADAVPKFMTTGLAEGFKIHAEQLQVAITSKTKLLVLNSPSNPSGAMYSRAELEQLAAVLLRHPDVIIASDDIYEKIVLGDIPPVSLLEVCPELKPRTVLLNGVSKAYAMTGWRIGYAAGPAPLIQAMKKVQSQSTSNPASISQHAALAALTGDQGFIGEMNKEFAQRNRFVVDSLNAMSGGERQLCRRCVLCVC